MVLPVTVFADGSSSFALSSAARRSAMPPAANRSLATKRPDGFRSAIHRRLRADAIEVGERQLDAGFARDRQQVQHGVGRSAGRGHRRDRVLEAPARVMMSRGLRPLFTRSMTQLPAARATAALPGCVAGTLPLPSAAMPRNSTAVAIVFAVNCPPHAPAPGHAADSSDRRSCSVILPAACAPTASNTS